MQEDMQETRKPAQRFLSGLVAIALIGVLSSCTGKSDYLKDLSRTSPRSTTRSDSESAFIYDRTQIAHEALTGLAVAEDLTREEATAAVARASRFLLRAANTPLLRADAAILLAELTVRTPFVEAGEPYKYAFDSKRAQQMVGRLEEIRKPLVSGGLVAALDTGDEVQMEAALERLTEESGQSFGRDIEAWKKWWEESRPERVAAFVEDSREPVDVLGGMRYEEASAAHAVLLLLNLWFKEVADPTVDAAMAPLLDRIARQAVVLCLVAGLRDSSALVRRDVVRAMKIVGDPSFGEPLRMGLGREADDDVRMLMVSALVRYPKSSTIVSLINTMSAGDSRIRLMTHDVLGKMTGAICEPTATSWSSWWRKTGESRWP